MHLLQSSREKGHGLTVRHNNLILPTIDTGAFCKIENETFLTISFLTRQFWNLKAWMWLRAASENGFVEIL